MIRLAPLAAALLASAGALLAPAVAAQAPAPRQAATRPTPRVSFDDRSFLIDGKPTLIWSGEFHPFRLPSPSLWRDILQKMKASGFNTVALYFDWGFHSPKQGVYDFTGIRDLDRVLDMAKEEGLYVITRAGPYVNAELTRGGFPGWLVNQRARARTDDPEYLAAVDEWLTQVNRIIARHQLNDGRGTVILHQIENELALTTPSQARYMQHLFDKARADGITVPIFHNDQGRNGYWVPKSSDVPGTVPGPVDLYAFDGYPGAVCDVHNNVTKGAPAPDWGLYGTGARGGASASPRTPGFIAEFGGGWFDYWGSNGMYPCNAKQRGVGYQRIFYGTNLANGIAAQSFYMTYGGTSWGWLPAPVVYTSYDYGAAISEPRILRDKALELKQLGQFATGVPDLARLEKAPPVEVSDQGVQVYHDRNPDTDGRLLFVAHKPSTAGGDKRFTITADLPHGRYTFASELHGQDAKLLLAGVAIERQRLVYSTSEFQTAIRRGPDDVALFYGRAGEPGETVFRFAAQPKVTVLDGEVRSTWDPARRDLKLSYTHRGLARVRIEGGAMADVGAPLTLLIGDVAEAQRFFRPDANTLVRGPSLVRRATRSGTSLALTGDTAGPEPLEVWTDAARLRWNGATVAAARTPSGSLSARAALPAPRAFTLPALTGWRAAEGTPEADPAFDDSRWVAAGGAPARSTVRPPTGQPNLSMDSYGFHEGDVWYRGRFAGSPEARTIQLHYGAGGAGMLQLWLDGRFVGQHELPAGLPRPITTGVAEFALPAEATQPGEHVLSVMVRNNGHNWDLDSDDFHKEARGLVSVSLQRPGGISFAVPIRWKIQGRQGGEDLVDPVRGVPNNGGQFGERMGWHLPGFDDKTWSSATVPAAAPVTGTRWYRTRFDLAVPSGDDATVAVQLGDPDSPRSPGPGRYRVLLFVNGWHMGQFAANVGPQRTFPIPEGILNHRGANTLALAVTGDGQPGAALEQVRLVTLHHVRGGLPVEPVAAPQTFKE